MKLIVHDGVEFVRAARLASQLLVQFPNKKTGIRNGCAYGGAPFDDMIYVYRTKTAIVVRPASKGAD